MKRRRSYNVSTPNANPYNGSVIDGRGEQEYNSSKLTIERIRKKRYMVIC